MAAGTTERFARLGKGVLRRLLAGVDPDRDLDSAVEHVMGGFASLSVHADVPDGEYFRPPTHDVASLPQLARSARPVTGANGKTLTHFSSRV